MMKRARGDNVQLFSVPTEDQSLYGGVVEGLAVRAGRTVSPGQLVCNLRVKGGTLHPMRFHGNTDALVLNVCCREGLGVDLGQTILEYRVCEHAVVVHGLCTTCMQDVSKLKDGEQRVQMMPSQPDFLFHRGTAELVAEQTKARLLETRKLSLVLDLDLTLLHATHDYRHGEVVFRAPEDDARDIHTFEMGGRRFWIKLRPGLDEFLERAHAIFELHIFTHGSKEYGHRIASIIDPTGVYFSPQQGMGEKRITCMDDAYGEEERRELRRKKLRDYKRLERLFPVSRHHVLVLDDNSVWGTSPNVLRVVPYVFWNAELPDVLVGQFEADNEMPPPATPINFFYKSEAAHETHLQELQALLKRIHWLFFQSETPEKEHCAVLFAQARSEILAGCVIAFSAVYPQETAESDMPLVALLQDYGAEFRKNLEAGVTHLVACKCRSDKVLQAKTAGLEVVHMDWLIDSIRHFRRMNEDEYRDLPQERRPGGSRMQRFLKELVDAYLNYKQDLVEEDTVKEGGEEEEIDMDEMMRLLDGT